MRNVPKTVSAMICVVAMTVGALAQSAPDPVAEFSWGVSAASYATAAACARKRLAFSSKDVQTLKAIAVQKAEGLDPDKVNERWHSIVMGLQFQPPTIAQCLDAFEKETFTGSGPFGF